MSLRAAGEAIPTVFRGLPCTAKADAHNDNPKLMFYNQVRFLFDFCFICPYICSQKNTKKF
ncbi:MAG: hypothetical protein KAS18_10955 [Calditrichia bacterium]|nr:hypothetical protein [Calditrichia bacterium]